jgi:hypothetical protein
VLWDIALPSRTTGDYAERGVVPNRENCKNFFIYGDTLKARRGTHGCRKPAEPDRANEFLIHGPATGLCDFVDMTIEAAKVKMHYLWTPIERRKLKDGKKGTSLRGLGSIAVYSSPLNASVG